MLFIFIFSHILDLMRNLVDGFGIFVKKIVLLCTHEKTTEIVT